MINHQFDNDMSDLAKMPADLKVLVNHIYEYQKGVRPMVLFTCKKQYEEFATSRLANQDISFVTQPVGNKNINIFFGKEECINAIKLMVNRPLNQLSPEEDFYFRVFYLDMISEFNAKDIANVNVILAPKHNKRR